MNLVLLFEKDFISPSQVQLTGRRWEHITTVLKSKPGDSITVGLCNGGLGKGEVIKTGKEILLNVAFDQSPPEPLPMILILALPRPQAFKRTLLAAASMGIKKIIVLNFNRVEKSLWNSSSLRPEEIQEQLVLGLEQGKDTILPQVVLKKRFKPFVEDELPLLMKGTMALVAHPMNAKSCPRQVTKPVTLIVGPEGGIIDYELDRLAAIGFKSVTFGPRILRTESVVPFLIGRLF